LGFKKILGRGKKQIIDFLTFSFFFFVFFGFFGYLTIIENDDRNTSLRLELGKQTTILINNFKLSLKCYHIMARTNEKKKSFLFFFFFFFK
jgi:hypothetical protein